jgi:hypothetical protein
LIKKKATTKSFPLRRNGIYFTPTPGISVTEILSGGWPKPALQYWMGREAAKAALNDPTLDESEVMAKVRAISGDKAKIGSTVHAMTEAIDNTTEQIDIKTVAPIYSGYIKAFLDFKEQFKPKLLHNEATVYNATFKFAGTCDRIYQMGDKTVLLDIKTSKAYYPDMALQLSAYQHAEFFYDKDTKVSTPMIKIDELAILLLAEDGTFSYHQAPDKFKLFLYAFEIYKYLNPEKMELLSTNKEAN